ncbi:MAG TPA: RNA polymerase sigma factor [Salinimicrobium sp.]|nr:RNA polymerase sigma factor [Salinimicrobium sp.]
MLLTKPHFDETIERCLRGDQRAQMEIYRKYYKAMYNTALRIVQDPAEAEDIMQESFLNAFSKIASFKGNATFGSWLKRIVINNSLSAHKKNNKFSQVSYEEHFRDSVEPDEYLEGLTTLEVSENNASQILKAINGLKENYRVLLNLHFIEGYDYEEICQILSISSASCRTSISRAKESLRKTLMPYETV